MINIFFFFWLSIIIIDDGNYFRLQVIVMDDENIFRLLVTITGNAVCFFITDNHYQ